MNVETGVQCFAIAAAFSLLPKSASAPAAFFALLYGALYFLQGQIPNVLKDKDA
jgi:hypothetical protein